MFIFFSSWSHVISSFVDLLYLHQWDRHSTSSRALVMKHAWQQRRCFSFNLVWPADIYTLNLISVLLTLVFGISFLVKIDLFIFFFSLKSFSVTPRSSSLGAFSRWRRCWPTPRCTRRSSTAATWKWPTGSRRVCCDMKAASRASTSPPHRTSTSQRWTTTSLLTLVQTESKNRALLWLFQYTKLETGGQSCLAGHHSLSCCICREYITLHFTLCSDILSHWTLAVLWQNLVRVGSAILSPDTRQHWELIQHTEGGTAALLRHYEEYANTLAQNMRKTYLSPFTIVTPNIGLQYLVP